jgi:hypothetical protein
MSAIEILSGGATVSRTGPAAVLICTICILRIAPEGSRTNTTFSRYVNGHPSASIPAALLGVARRGRKGICTAPTRPTAPNFRPGMRRTSTIVGIDTYRPLRPTPEFLRIAG